MAYMTQEGYDKLVAQLRHMEQIDRPAASAAIAEARDKGDLLQPAQPSQACGELPHRCHWLQNIELIY